MAWYDKPYMYEEVAKVDRDYADECPALNEITPDYDSIFNFILKERERFGDIYPKEHVEYYQIKGSWCAGNGYLDLYRDNTESGSTYRLYRRVF